MKSVQIGTAVRPPASPSPSDLPSSKPSHTATSRSGEKPTNQASRLSLEVPVLPARGRRMRAPAARAVPSSTTLRMSDTDQVGDLRAHRRHRLVGAGQLLAVDRHDQARAQPLAAVGEGGEGAGQLERGHAVGAERERQPHVGGHRGGDAGPGRQVDHRRHPHLVEQADGHRVDRVGEGGAQADGPAELLALVVLRLPQVVDLGRVVHHGGGRAALHERGGVDERLEGRSRLAGRPLRAIVAPGPVVVARPPAPAPRAPWDPAPPWRPGAPARGPAAAAPWASSPVAAGAHRPAAPAPGRPA